MKKTLILGIYSRSYGGGELNFVCLICGNKWKCEMTAEQIEGKAESRERYDSHTWKPRFYKAFKNEKDYEKAE